jgi:hypothetical protein
MILIISSTCGLGDWPCNVLKVVHPASSFASSKVLLLNASAQILARGAISFTDGRWTYCSTVLGVVSWADKSSTVSQTVVSLQVRCGDVFLPYIFCGVFRGSSFTGVGIVPINVLAVGGGAPDAAKGSNLFLLGSCLTTGGLDCDSFFLVRGFFGGPLMKFWVQFNFVVHVNLLEFGICVNQRVKTCCHWHLHSHWSP